MHKCECQRPNNKCNYPLYVAFVQDCYQVLGSMHPPLFTLPTLQAKNILFGLTKPYVVQSVLEIR